MKYILEVSSRASLDITAESKHDNFINSLKLIDAPWGVSSGDIFFPGFGTSHVSIFTISKYLGKGIKSTLFYRYRNLLSDHHSCDDRMYMEFNPEKVDYSYLVNFVFSQYIKIFNAYSGRIFNEDIAILDFEKSRNKNRRNAIIRFDPICFFDRELCKRALNLTPEVVYTRLKDHVERVEVFNDGVLIIKSSNILTIEEANEFNTEIYRLLGVG